MESLHGKKVLVTGADGFIGSHLVERLLDLGADVRPLCLYNSNGSLGWLDGLPATVRKDLDSRLGDVRDARFVREAVRDVEVVFHLAALIAIPYSYQAPSSFVDTNVTGTLNVLEAVRDCDTPLMIQTSTSEVYGTPQRVPIDEEHPLKGQSPYSASKIGADKLCEAYALSFETPVVTLRPFNTFGPRQSARAVIPTILQQLLAGADQVRLGSLSPKRDFTFVSDTVEGFVKMATADVPPGEVVQLGTGQTVTIGDLFETCCRATGSNAAVVVDQDRVRPSGSEVEVLLSDPAKAKAMIDWEPTVNLEDGLRETAASMKDGIDPELAAVYQR